MSVTRRLPILKDLSASYKPRRLFFPNSLQIHLQKVDKTPFLTALLMCLVEVRFASRRVTFSDSGNLNNLSASNSEGPVGFLKDEEANFSPIRYKFICKKVIKLLF